MNSEFKNLKFTDDFMFCRVMQNNEDVAKGVLESILGHKIGDIVQAENQKSIQITDDGHGVRFDVYLKDGDNKVYDIEMQTANYDEIPRRSRYYQSMLDRSLLKKGQNYAKLNDSYIIFIMLQDIFGMGYNVYEFESICTRADNRVLGDGAKRIFVNAEKVEKNAPPELRNFISYLLDGKARDPLTKLINECIEDAKLDPRMEGDFMTLLEMKQEAFKEGKSKGLAEAALHAIPAMIERGISMEDACEIQGITPDEYQALKDSLTN